LAGDAVLHGTIAAGDHSCPRIAKHMRATAIIDATGEITLSGSVDPVPWWSFTKTALAIATLRLAQDFMLDLDETLPGEPFTARQLLRHEAGLPDYGMIARYHADVAAGRRAWPLDRLLAAVEASRLRHPPGTGWAYSNIGYLRIAQLIERVAGLSLGEALSSLVFDQAGLKTARLALKPGDTVDVQMGNVSRYDPGWVYHGLIVGTVADAARLLWALVSGRLLEQRMFGWMIEPRPLPDYRSDSFPDPAYGLGLMLNATDAGAHPLGHSGEGPGSRIAVYAKADKAVAVWSASPCEMDPEAQAYEMLSR
jgi:CubicO group peptidase (beta-lactamase class C family)